MITRPSFLNKTSYGNVIKKLITDDEIINFNEILLRIKGIKKITNEEFNFLIDLISCFFNKTYTDTLLTVFFNAYNYITLVLNIDNNIDNYEVVKMDKQIFLNNINEFIPFDIKNGEVIDCNIKFYKDYINQKNITINKNNEIFKNIEWMNELNVNSYINSNINFYIISNSIVNNRILINEMKNYILKNYLANEIIILLCIFYATYNNILSMIFNDFEETLTF